MREYGKVSPRIWTGKLGRSLRGDPPTQLVALYLVTCQHANMIGLFLLPVSYIAADTGLPPAKVEAALSKLEAMKFCRYDHDTDRVWVVEHLRHEMGGQQVLPKDKRYWAIIGALTDHSCSALVSDFLGFYGIDAALLAVENKHGGAPSLTVQREVKERDGSICRHCGQTVDWNDRRGKNGATYDHVDPFQPATVENTVVSCRSCNSSKGQSIEGLKPIQIGSVSDLDRIQIGSSQIEKPGAGAETEASAGSGYRAKSASRVASPSPGCLAAFEVWRQSLPEASRSRTILNEKRQKAYNARIAEGHPQEQIEAALRGWKNDSWDKRPEQNDMTILLRDGGQVEKFAALDGKPRQTVRRLAGTDDERQNAYANRAQKVNAEEVA